MTHLKEFDFRTILLIIQKKSQNAIKWTIKYLSGNKTITKFS